MNHMLMQGFLDRLVKEAYYIQRTTTSGPKIKMTPDVRDAFRKDHDSVKSKAKAYGVGGGLGVLMGTGIGISGPEIRGGKRGLIGAAIGAAIGGTVGAGLSALYRNLKKKNIEEGDSYRGEGSAFYDFKGGRSGDNMEKVYSRHNKSILANRKDKSAPIDVSGMRVLRNKKACACIDEFIKTAVSTRLIDKIIRRNPKYMRDVKRLAKHTVDDVEDDLRRGSRKMSPIDMDVIENSSLETLRSQNISRIAGYNSIFPKHPLVKKKIQTEMRSVIKDELKKQQRLLSEARELRFYG